MNIKFKYGWLLIFITLLSGCDNDGKFKDLRVYIEQLKQTAELKQKNKVIPSIQPPASMTYQADKLRPPFALTEASVAKTSSTLNPLQAYPLTMLRFVGTVLINHLTFAYIATPDNMIYQVKEGDIIGDQRGKITNIQPDRLDVMELESEAGRPAMQRIVTLQLKE